MNPTTKNPVKITDVTFRDGHQSIFATRMRTEDMVNIAPEMDRIGFYSMEVWGGATFDVATRFLNEDPWERPRVLKKLMPHTPLQMLLRGQNLLVTGIMPMMSSKPSSNIPPKSASIFSGHSMP